MNKNTMNTDLRKDLYRICNTLHDRFDEQECRFCNEAVDQILEAVKAIVPEKETNYTPKEIGFNNAIDEVLEKLL